MPGGREWTRGSGLKKRGWRLGKAFSPHRSGVRLQQQCGAAVGELPKRAKADMFLPGNCISFYMYHGEFLLRGKESRERNAIPRGILSTGV
jgi:hypothetical protein